MKTVLGCSARFAAIAVSGMIAAAAPPASAHEDADPHAHHHMMRDMKMSSVAYSLPDVTLVRDDDRAVSLKDALNDGRPVVLTFIYTTCTSICPVISQTLSQLQAKLGQDRDKVHLVSISIDPENDTPRACVRMRRNSARGRNGSTTPARLPQALPRRKPSMCSGRTRWTTTRWCCCAPRRAGTGFESTDSRRRMSCSIRITVSSRPPDGAAGR